jgi:hypothetical protein
MHEHDRSTDLICHFTFGSFGNIVAYNVRGTIFFVNGVLVEVGNGVAVV